MATRKERAPADAEAIADAGAQPGDIDGAHLLRYSVWGWRGEVYEPNKTSFIPRSRPVGLKHRARLKRDLSVAGIYWLFQLTPPDQPLAANIEALGSR